MKKVLLFLNKILKLILWVILSLVLLFFIIAILIQIPAIQTKIVRYATTFISDKTHTKVDIKKISISFPKSVVIQELFLEDSKKDTLLYAGKLKINISFNDLFKSKIHLNSVALDDINLKLNRTASDSLFNYNFLIAAFSDTTTPKKVVPETKSKWTFSIDNVSMKNIHLHYDDDYGGSNVAANLEQLSLKMDELDLAKSVYRIDHLLIEGLTANVLLKKSVKKVEESSTQSILPIISANKIQINNTKFVYSNSIGKQFLTTTIGKFQLKTSTIDLQKQMLSLDKIALSKTKIQYNTNTSDSSSTPIIEDEKTSSGKSDWKISVKDIDLNDNSLAYKVVNTPEIKTFDANNLDYKHLSLKAKNLYYSTDKTEVSISGFSAVDQNNFSVSKLETDFSMDSHSITAKKLKIKTARSSIDADFNIQYASLKSLMKYLPLMQLNVAMRNIVINNADVLYFSPQLKKQAFFKNAMNITTISGKINGKVNHLKGTNLQIKTGVNTNLTSNFIITGLPDIQTADFDFPNLKIKSGRQDVAMLAGKLIPNSIELPEEISMEIVFNGQIKSFESTLNLNSSYGDAHLFANIDKNEKFNSKLSIANFDLGSLLKNKAMFGPVSLNAETNGQGFDKNTIKAKIKAEATQVYLNKYTYHNLKIDGNVNGQMFDGKINLKDENAAFDFDGLVNLNPNQENYKFHLNLQGADLKKLNLSKDDIRISLIAASNLKGKSINEMNGKAWISDIIVAHNEKKYGLDSVFIDLTNQPDKSIIRLRSAIADIMYNGSFSPMYLPKTLNHFINNYFPFSEDDSTKMESGNFTFEMQLHNHPILSEVLFPQLKEFEPGLIKGSFDSKKDKLEVNAIVKRIVYGNTEIANLALDVNSDINALNYKISSSKISNAQLKIDNFSVNGKLADKTIVATVSSIDEKQNKKFLISSQIVKHKTNFKITISPKDFYLMNNRWDIAADNYIEFGKQGFLIHHLFINKTNSEINIASVHDVFNDDLNIGIKNFKLEDISGIIEKDSNIVKGNIDGNLLLKRIDSTYGIIADAQISNLFVREVPIGNLMLKAKNSIAERFDIALSLSGIENNLTANGYFYPKGGDNSINIKTDIQSLSLKTVEAFSMGTITKASGKLTGNFLIEGNIAEPDITGELIFNNAFVTPAVLNNQLQLKHETIQLKKSGIYFNSFTILDANQQTAVIDGSIQMKQFKDFVFDMHVNTKDFLLFNTTAKDNKEFYGKMIIDSKIDVNGPMLLPVVFAKLKMKKGSNFTFAVSEKGLTTDKGEDVVAFENTLKLNSILNRENEKQLPKSGLKGFDLSSIIEVDKEATLKLLLDPSSTDSLVVKGEAALSFTIDRSGKMSLTGAYNLNDGSYIVSLESIIKKRFTIDPGSTIIWNGDPLDADISINAIYSVRTAPYDLVADQMNGLSESEKGGYKQHYPFLVILKLRGEILHPQISFEIQLAPENKGILGGAVNAKLNMLNEDVSALNKQVFALLVLGRFIQENPLQTESTSTMSTVRSTVGSLLSAQLNQLSSKVISGIEFNFDIQSYDDYQTGQAEGRTQVDIVVKKQLFNERLTVQIGGTMDVEGEKAKQNSVSDIASDVSVEYKLKEDGRYRLKAFRHNQYEGAIEGQLIETGIGVLYVRDFENWKEFFRSPKDKIDSSKKENSNDTNNPK
ncbi:MAG: translocation/assembly module TamB [Bacteroidetes bacterium]|nr:translocation/assembly module TamB [Bacteroidota bacterium]